MSWIVVRFVGIVFALIEAALLIRLVLPFVDTVPKALRPFAVQLVRITDQLVAPFQVAAHPFELGDLRELPTGVVAVVQAYADRLDPAVLIAMIAWGLISTVTLLVLRLALRP